MKMLKCLHLFAGMFFASTALAAETVTVTDAKWGNMGAAPSTAGVTTGSIGNGNYSSFSFNFAAADNMSPKEIGNRGTVKIKKLTLVSRNDANANGMNKIRLTQGDKTVDGTVEIKTDNIVIYGSQFPGVSGDKYTQSKGYYVATFASDVEFDVSQNITFQLLNSEGQVTSYGLRMIQPANSVLTTSNGWSPAIEIVGDYTYAPSPTSEVVALFNFKSNDGTDAAGWTNHTQPDGGMIPKSGTLSMNGVTFATNSKGNFFPDNTSVVNTDYPSAIIADVKETLGLSDSIDFDANVYKTGLMNGGQSGHTATISGLTTGSEYVVYFGFGRLKTDDNNQVGGFTLNDCGSFASLEYVVTVAGQNTTVSQGWTSFTKGTAIRPGSNGLMMVKLAGVTPTNNGTIVFTMSGARGQINFLAVKEKELPPPGPAVSATISADTTWSALWEGGTAPVENTPVELTFNGSYTLSLNADAVGKSFKILGTSSADQTIKIDGSAANVAAFVGKVTLDSTFIGKVDYEFDATTASFTADDALKNAIKSASTNTKFVFKGADNYGATVDFDSANKNGTISSHIVLKGGSHLIKNGNAGTFANSTTCTAENPAIFITNGATLNFEGHDLNGWTGSIITGFAFRVDDGATLNLKNFGGTFFFRQQMCIVPGGTVNVPNGYNFELHGGNGTPEIVVPDAAVGNTKVATISGGIRFRDGENGASVAASVGANAILKIGPVALYAAGNDASIKKTGEGILEIASGTMAPKVIMGSGVLKLDDEATLSQVILDSATEVDVVSGSATLNAISGDFAITKTGAGTLNLPAAYTQTITLTGGQINRTATNTVVINGDIDLGTTEMPLSWAIDATSTGSIKLPTGFPFGQIAKASALPEGLAFKDSTGATISADKLEIDGGYIVLKKSEITTPYNVAEPTIIEDDLVFGEGGSINITHNGAMLMATGTITLPESSLPVTFICEDEYVVGTKISVVAAKAFKVGDIDATFENFTCKLTGKLPKGMEGEFQLVEEEGMKAIVFAITKSTYYTAEVAEILEKNTLQVRFDASCGVVVDDNGKVTEWKDISGNGNNATPVHYKHITDTPTLFSSDDDLREYVDFGERGSHQDLRIGSTVNGKTIFLVIDIQEDKDAFILGWGNDSDSYGGNYDFHRNVLYYFNGDSQVFAVRDNKIDKGNGRSELLKSGFRVLSLRTDGNGRFNSFSSDRNGCSDGENRTGGRKLCEVISFSEKLSDGQTETIEDYLLAKWGLNYRNEANIVGEIAWSEIQWKGGRYYADVETTLTVTGDTVLTFDTPIGNPDIEFIQESPDYQLEFVIEKESGCMPDMMIGAGEQLTLRGGTSEDPFVYTGWVSVEEGGTLVIDGGSVECEGFWGDGIVDVQRGEFRLGSMRGVKLNFAENTALLVDANAADGGEVTLMFESGSASPTVRFVDAETRHAVIVPVAGGVKITYDPEVSGKACLYDWTFDNGVDKGDNRLASVGRNTSALSWDTDYSKSNGFVTDEAFTYGTALNTKSTPYSDFTVDYPTEWTCMVAGVLPNVTNGALITFGTQGDGLIGLIAGSTENEVKIVRTTGNAQYVALATMTVPNARTTSHCYAFVKTEEKIVVYLDGVKWNETEVRGANFGARLQIGSVHGGVGSTGITKVDNATNATAIQAVRIFEGVLGPKSLRKLAEEFPYLSENGTFTRTFSSASENWVSDESWAKVGSGDKFSEPDAGSELKITASASTTVKMNFDGANAVYENVSINGSGSLTFDVGEEGYFAVNAGKTDVNVPITLKYGSLTIAVGPTTIGSSGSITFDYSAYPVDTIHSEGFIQLTGQIDEQSPDKIRLVKPTALLERRMDLVYRDEVYGIEYGFARDPIDLYFKNPTEMLALTNETELVDIDGNAKSRMMKDDVLVVANNATFTIATTALDVQLSTLKITNATVTVNIPAANLNGLAEIIVEDGGTLKFDSAAAAAYTGAIIVNEGGVFDVNGIPDLLMEVTLNGGTMTNSGADVGVGKKQFPTMNFTDDSVIDVVHDFGSIAQGYGAHTVNLDGNVVEKRGAGNYYLVNATIGGGGEFKVTEGTLAISSGLTIPADTEFKLTVDSAATISFANTVTKSGVFNLEVGGSLSAPITLAIDELTINQGAVFAITSSSAITAVSAVQNGSFTVDLSQLELDETRKRLLAAPGLDIAHIDFTVSEAVEKRLYRLVYIDEVLYVEPNNLTIAIPSVDNADVSVLVDGEPVEVVDNSITIIRGSGVVVTYVANLGWLFNDATDHKCVQRQVVLDDVQEAPNPSIDERLRPYIPLVEAKVSIGDVYYLDFCDALAEVAANEEIRLWEAVVLGDEYNVSCDMAINLNGFEMSAEEALSFIIAGGNSLYLYDGYEFAKLLGGELNNIRFNLSEGTIYSYLNLDSHVDSDRYVRIYSSKVGYTYVTAESVPELVSKFVPGETETVYLPCESEATLIPLVEKAESFGYALEPVSAMSTEYKVIISPDEAVNGSKIESFEIAGGKATITIPAKSNLYYGLEYANNPAFSGSQVKWAKQGATTLSAEAEGANMFYRVVITDKDPNIK